MRTPNIFSKVEKGGIFYCTMYIKGKFFFVVTVLLLESSTLAIFTWLVVIVGIDQ